MPGEDRTYAGEFQEEAPPRAATTYLKQLSESFKTGRYSDLTISCGGRQWKVHSFQLSHQSEVFERMLHGAFKVGLFSCRVGSPLLTTSRRAEPASSPLRTMIPMP